MIEDIIFSGNGLDYVNLGLPSGTLWSAKNVGASKPSDYGKYFQWGDTIGYTDREVGYDGGQTEFKWKNYKWNLGGDGKTFTKYENPGDKLELEDDAAHVRIGDLWHIPTPEQIRELLDNTISTWVTQDGVNGRLFTSKKDDSKSIFIPAAGFALNASVHNNGSNCYVWSSILSPNDVDYGQILIFSSDDVYLSGNYRFYGHSVRGVIG